MPAAVQRAVDATIDDIWPDVKIEVMGAVLDKMAVAKVPVDHGRPPPCCGWPGPLAWLRAGFLYTLRPYDRSLWRRLRNPLFLLLTLASVFPLFGVPQAFYLAVLLAIDHSDEFQLVDFILSFKGVQFITGGLFPACYGAVLYYLCTTGPDSPAVNECAKTGPTLPLWEAGFFLLQVVMVWLAAALLPRSEKKGGTSLEVLSSAHAQYDVDGNGILSPDEVYAFHARHGTPSSDDGSRSGDASAVDPHSPGRIVGSCCGKPRYAGRGGRLRAFVILDAFVFLVCFSVIVWAALDDHDRRTSIAAEGLSSNWRLKSTIYWTKTLYGLLSVHFLIFKVPILGRLLTHARPTGYNRHGKHA
ncbi:uncharacterized protein AMSG_11150 [Thecamonas trahens ATCC 50062]|uniref:EF-hand domain-containing protein n=1 Tax=Thecamonas trahens ATCC 50062 TaxID=461836 RepID=A0A0L0DW59_THETB|nr:hypothetical protein AMSG_11150 [Thecamonas trahens ATCC 50062]KNC55753.1 hypothetical protein AMSG_11150 [Thecamonas trahens ATCC 50062]|eukprot:XP_013752906.1 hypothetical protein AMSG_11150 [Thecamonas trahens ATCC 50062]